MRKIEQSMNRAIASGRDWANANTRVEHTAEGSALVYLHGNHIATIRSDGSVYANPYTFASWPTRTTASRLRALGVDARISDGAPLIDGGWIL